MIKNLKISNFKGIEESEISFSSNKACFSGVNGRGKSSTLAAIRYVLTGEEPEGIVKKGAHQASVEAELADGTRIQRVRDAKGNTITLNGKKVTQKALDAYLEEKGVSSAVPYVTTDKIEDSVSSRKMAELFGKYVKKAFTMSSFTGLKPEEEEVLVAFLPEEFTLEKVEEIHLEQKAFRTEVNSKIKGLQQLQSTKVAECELNESEVRSALEEALGKRASLAALEKQYAAFLSAKERVAIIKSKIDEIVVTRPALTEEQVKEKAQKLTSEMNSKRSVIKSLEDSSQELKKMLSALETAVCPLSPLVKCTSDKSIAAEDIQLSIDGNEMSISLLKEEIKTLEEEQDELDEVSIDLAAYKEKMRLQKELLEAEKLQADLACEAPAKEDEASSTVEALQEKLKTIESHKDYIAISSQIESEQEMQKMLDSFVKLTAPGGLVRTQLTSITSVTLEKVVKDRVSKYLPDYDFKFVALDGLTFLMSTPGKPEFRTYAELSGGEKEIYLFVLRDLINVLTDAKILILDELSVMDREKFGVLINLAESVSADYENIIITCLPHLEDIVIKSDFELITI